MVNQPQQMDSKALMQSINAISPAANPQTAKDRQDDSSKRLEFLNSIRALLKKLIDDGVETDQTNIAILSALRIAVRQMMLSAEPSFTMAELTKHLGELGTPMGAPGGVPGQMPGPGTGIAGVGMGQPQQPPTAQPPPMAG